MTRYMTARIARSVADTALFHSSDDRGERGHEGDATAARLTRFSSLVMTSKYSRRQEHSNRLSDVELASDVLLT